MSKQSRSWSISAHLATAALGVCLSVSPPGVSAQGGNRGRGGGAGATQAPPPPGDIANGKALVETQKCLTCHRIGETGSRLGPDLSVVGQVRSPDSLRLALEDPDVEVQPEHRYARVITKDGMTVTGRLLNQDAFTVQMLTEKEELKSYLRSNLRQYTILDKGLMPSYKATLTPQQIADIVNYLASLKPVPPPAAGRQGQ